MFPRISSKSIFGFLTLALVFSFVVNHFQTKDLNVETKFLTIKKEQSRSKKIMGAKIYKQTKKGEQYLIVAETLKESKTKNGKVELENSVTTINKNGITTTIIAGYAIIANNFETFNLSKKVKTTKKTRNFVLTTNSLVGELEKGNFFTNDKVDIISRNIKINGEGLDFKRNGEYIKINGKAKLIMFLSKKNEI